MPSMGRQSERVWENSGTANTTGVENRGKKERKMREEGITEEEEGISLKRGK